MAGIVWAGCMPGELSSLRCKMMAMWVMIGVVVVGGESDAVVEGQAVMDREAAAVTSLSLCSIDMRPLFGLLCPPLRSLPPTCPDQCTSGQAGVQPLRPDVTLASLLSTPSHPRAISRRDRTPSRDMTRAERGGRGLLSQPASLPTLGHGKSRVAVVGGRTGASLKNALGRGPGRCARQESLATHHRLHTSIHSSYPHLL